MDSVYIVSDCGINWPAAGMIFGVYNTNALAVKRLQDLKDGPEFMMNQNTSG